jgi:hypothetical protein
VTTWGIIFLLLALPLLLGWWLSWWAARVHRADARAEGTWAALDAVLVRRAQWAAQVASSPDVDPATALLVIDAAAATLEPHLSRSERERAESDLSHVLAAVALELGPRLDGLAQLLAQIGLSRRLHNEAAATARWLHRRWLVLLFRLAGGRTADEPFEMSGDQLTVWPAIAGPGAGHEVGPIRLNALPPPTGHQYARAASMSTIAARPAPSASSAQRAGKL